MGLRGRKAKPAAEHIRTGTAAKKVLDERHESTPMQWKPPVMPTRISKEAAVIWLRIVPSLSADRLVSHYDEDLLLDYCEAVAWREKIQKTINKREYTMNAEGKYTPHPQLKSLERIEKQIERYRDQLGLTPKSRKAMNIVLKAPRDENATKKASVLTRRK